MKFFSTSQIQQIDRYTIEHEPILSIDLMERASDAIFKRCRKTLIRENSIAVFAGPGNNGGDALVVARKLLQSGFTVYTYVLHTGKVSDDCSANLERLNTMPSSRIENLKEDSPLPKLSANTVIIDGLFGSGLTRPLKGFYAKVVDCINQSNCKVISIDIPSGLQGEENNSNNTKHIVKANLTLSLQFPKLAFFFPENAPFVGQWEVIDISLHQDAIEKTESNLNYLDRKDIAPLIKQRSKFSHKGTYGHCFIIAGKRGMAGAAILNSKAALRSGAGLVTVHSASYNRTIIQSAFPEAIFEADRTTDCISSVKIKPEYDAIAIGSGIGTGLKTKKMLEDFLKKNHQVPVVLDADALNTISRNIRLLNHLPNNCIITPHPKEFERLFGQTTNTFERIKKASEMAVKLNITIVAKDTYTAIALPNGEIYFNTTGNNGMATAGSGDVLTGILCGLLAQGYEPCAAAIIGVYLHGLAGDIALNSQSEESLIASDIIEELGYTFKLLRY